MTREFRPDLGIQFEIFAYKNREGHYGVTIKSSDVFGNPIDMSQEDLASYFRTLALDLAEEPE